MQLEVEPYHINPFPLAGLLIKGNSLSYWLEQLQHLQVDVRQTPVYAVPGTTANSIWGCFLPMQEAQWRNKDLNANEPCQYVYQNLYIPQYATIYPMLNAAEVAKLFPDTPHLLHPELGLIALDTPIEWSALLTLPAATGPSVTAPVIASAVPSQIRRAEIRPLPPDEALQAMEENAFPDKKSFSDKPLSWLEKIKLFALRGLMGPSKTPSDSDAASRSDTATGSPSDTATGSPSDSGTASRSDSGTASRSDRDAANRSDSDTGDNNFLQRWIAKIAGRLDLRNTKLARKLQENLEDLEQRNRTEMEKLMRLFRDNPEEALKYAIPLGDGTERGTANGRWEMGRFMNRFDLFGHSSSRGGGTTNFGDDAYSRLLQQYTETAQALIEQKEYHKAAFVYLKLLKNKQMAAQTLEQGNMYAEAASIYLKYLGSKKKAAECYEKGQMISEAINLYKDLKEHEKVGDLYMMQQDKGAAYQSYQVVADEYINSGKYVKASLLYRNKMDSAEPAQELLLTGWRKDRDAFNCINNYFQNIPDKQRLLHAIEEVYSNDTNESNKQVFLKALSYEQKKDEAIAARAKEIAYEIVADLAVNQPEIVSELRHFNNDVALAKDVGRYKAQNWK